MRIHQHVSRRLALPRAWWAHQGGASAVIFTIALAVLAPAGVGLVDVYMSTQQRAKLQDALDAATLYAARSNAQTSADADIAGDKALNANLKLISGATLQSSTFTLNGSKVQAVAQVRLPAFAPAFFDHQPITVNSEVQRGLDKLEVALVLDNTGSMVLNNSPKLATLKTQAKILIDKLKASAASSSDPTPLRISLVPFANTLRVQGTTSLSSYSASSHSGPGIPTWIDPQAKAYWVAGRSDAFSSQYSDRLGMMKAIGQSWAGCVEKRMQPYDVMETTPTSSDADTMYVPYFYPDAPDSNWSGTGWAKGDGYNDYLPDVTNDTNWKIREKYTPKYVSTTWRHTGTFNDGLGMTFTYGPNAGCVLQPLIRLTTDTDSVKTAIDGMTAIGQTDIPIGLAWGWNTLSPTGPFGDGLAYSTPHMKKIVILMTDGENTNYDSGDANASYYSGVGFLWQALSSLTTSMSSAQRTAQIDGRLAQLCTNMKAQHIYIYTIRVEVATGSSTLLQNCASSPDKFFDVTNVAALGAAFDAIAADITNLRISH